MIVLSPRLKTASDMVRKGVVVADIGPAHAYLPSYLVLNGICPRALACDLRKGPLENAAETLERWNISDKITLRLSDGLDELSAGEADDIIMAGMGGIPMSHAEEVRSFLCNNGFDIIEERTCRDDGRIYSVICAEYSGKIEVFPQGYEFYGKLDPNDDIARKLVERQHKRLKIRASSLREANFKLDEAEYCEKACLGMESFLNGGEK